MNPESPQAPLSHPYQRQMERLPVLGRGDQDTVSSPHREDLGWGEPLNHLCLKCCLPHPALWARKMGNDGWLNRLNNVFTLKPGPRAELSQELVPLLGALQPTCPSQITSVLSRHLASLHLWAD